MMSLMTMMIQVEIQDLMQMKWYDCNVNICCILNNDFDSH